MTGSNVTPAPPRQPADLIEFSVRKYRRSYRRYESKHPDIFNPIEQSRLREELGRAAKSIRSGAEFPQVLDLGCGSGNVTRHLLDLGLAVIAADVSPQFLDLVRDRFGSTGQLRTLEINGQDLSQLDDGSLDMVCAYSVLHHIPDYLAMVDEAARVVRSGGIVYLDHEANDNLYDKTGCFWDLLRATEQRRVETAGWWNPDGRRWQRYLMPSKYYTRMRQKFDPGYPWNLEGDIHTWEDDRIEWDQIEQRLAASSCSPVRRADYLNFSPEYPNDLWERYRDGCSNMRLLVARRGAE